MAVEVRPLMRHEAETDKTKRKEGITMTTTTTTITINGNTMNATPVNSEIKLTKKQKGAIWQARESFRKYYVTLRKGELDASTFDHAALQFESIMKDVHGIDVSGYTVLANLFSSVLTARKDKETGKKNARVPVSLNTFVKEYPSLYVGNEFICKDTKDPNATTTKRKPKTAEEKMADRKAATVAFLSQMNSDELAELLASLSTAA